MVPVEFGKGHILKTKLATSTLVIVNNLLPLLSLFGDNLVDVGVEPVEEGGARLGQRTLQVELPLDPKVRVPQEEREGESVLPLNVLISD